MEKAKKAYIAPLLTVVEFKAERGYAQSGFVMEASAINDYLVFQESQILVADQESHGEVVASGFGANVDQATGGSSWQYSNGSWF